MSTDYKSLKNVIMQIRVFFLTIIGIVILLSVNVLLMLAAFGGPGWPLWLIWFFFLWPIFVCGLFCWLTHKTKSIGVKSATIIVCNIVLFGEALLLFDKSGIDLTLVFSISLCISGILNYLLIKKLGNSKTTK